MQIMVKELKGKGCILEVTPTTTISDVKAQVQRKMDIPITNQKLLLLGRMLNDDQTLDSYPSIKDGTKINLVILKKNAENLHDVIYRSFRKYYSDQQSERLTASFMGDFESKLKLLSLDDLEIFADHLLKSCVPDI